MPGAADIPVRRHGRAPPLDDDLAYEEVLDDACARTIAEYGAAAVWLAALLAACLVGLVLLLG